MPGREHPRAIYLLCFLSGASGLVYQVVWARMLNQVFGVTIHAVTAVLATFLAGLALGSMVLGPLMDRRADPLRSYAWLEIGIALTALAGTALISAFDPVHVWAANRWAPDSVALMCIRSLLASAVILPPTFFMGGTLPALSRVVVKRLPQLGRQLSLVYAVNTFGAVVGSLASGFLLIRMLGLHTTLQVAAACNLAVAAASFWLAARRPVGAAASERGGERIAQRPTAVPPPAPGGRGVLWVMALSGMASLSLEVYWTRVLVLVLGTSSYAFVTMLSSFLVGISLGSFLARPLLGGAINLRRAFGWVQLGIAASTLASIPLMELLMGPAQAWCEGLSAQVPALIAVRFGISFAIMLVPTTLIGMTFPMAAKIWARQLPTLGGRLGQVYGANTLGNILGALCSGFVVLPAIGIQKGIATASILNLAGAAWGFFTPRQSRRRLIGLSPTLPVAGALGAVALALALWQPPPFAGSGGGPADPVRYYREGPVATVKVTQMADDGRQLMMFVDGTRIGQSSAGVDRKQQVLAHLPFLLRPEGALRKVASIGLGTGILIGEVTRHDGVESVECVELSPAVIEAARIFEPYNHGVLHNPAVRVVNDDGFNFLRRSQSHYDAIIADEKSRSGHAGNAVFYSDDYYRLCRSRLAPGGLMIQWVPLDVPEAELQTILRTFFNVFPHAYLWLGFDSVFVVGTEQPLVLDHPHMQRVLDAPAAAGLRRYGWRHAAEVASLLIADKRSLAPWLADDDTINSLERPVLEFYPLQAFAAPPAQHTADNLTALSATLPAEPLADVRSIGADVEATRRGTRAVRLVIESLARLGPNDAGPVRGAAQLLERALIEAPDHGVIRQIAAIALFNIGLDLDRAMRIADAVRWYHAAAAAWPELTEARINLGRALAALGRTEDGVTELREAVRLNPESGLAHRVLAGALQLGGALEEAILHYREALRIAPAMAEVHTELGVSLAMAGRPDEGLLQLREAMRLQPHSPMPVAKAALLLAAHPDASRRDQGEAVRLSALAARLSDRKDPIIVEMVAASYALAGRFDDAIEEGRTALQLANAAGDRALSERLAVQLDRYRRGLPPSRDLPAGTAD